MKKNVFKMMMLAFVVMSSISFAACGGDDDENGGKPDNNVPYLPKPAEEPALPEQQVLGTKRNVIRKKGDFHMEL